MDTTARFGDYSPMGRRDERASIHGIPFDNHGNLNQPQAISYGNDGMASFGQRGFNTQSLLPHQGPLGFPALQQNAGFAPQGNLALGADPGSAGFAACSVDQRLITDGTTNMNGVSLDQNLQRNHGFGPVLTPQVGDAPWNGPRNVREFWSLTLEQPGTGARTQQGMSAWERLSKILWEPAGFIRDFETASFPYLQPASATDSFAQENSAKALDKRKANETPEAAVVPPPKVQKLSPEEMTATLVDGGRTSGACNAPIPSTLEAPSSAASTPERILSALGDSQAPVGQNIERGEEIVVADPTRAEQGESEALRARLCRPQLPVGKAQPRADDANPADTGANYTGVHLDFRSGAAGQDSVDLTLESSEELPVPIVAKESESDVAQGESGGVDTNAELRLKNGNEVNAGEPGSREVNDEGQIAAHDSNVEVEGDDQSAEASLEADKSRNSDEVVGPDNSAVVVYQGGAADSIPPAHSPARVQAPARQQTAIVQRKTYNFTRAAILSSHPLLIARPSSTGPTPPMSPEQMEEARERDRALRGEFIRIELETARSLARGGNQGPFHVGDYLVNIDPANGHPRFQGLRLRG